MHIQKPHNIIFDLGHVIFHYDPQFVDELFNTAPEQVFKLIPDGFEILQRCHAQTNADGSRMHQLFVLSNATHQSLELMHTYFPQVFTHFDHIMTSAQVGMQKPDIRFYQHFLNTYRLAPENCIFIDDKQVNVVAAAQTGIHGIVFDEPERVKKELAYLGIW